MPPAPHPFRLKLLFSNQYTYAQILRKADGHIVASASTIEKALRTTLDNTANKEVRAANFVILVTPATIWHHM